MKKTFFSLVLFFCGILMFAETGYRGHEWYKDTTDMPSYGKIAISNKKLWLDVCLLYKRNILDDYTYLFYGYYKGDLESAGYLIPKDKTQQVKDKLKDKKKNEYKINIDGLSNIDKKLQEFKQSITDKENYKEQEDNLFYFSQLSYYASMIEIFGFNGLLDKKPNLTLTIYDYNDNTRCYIFEGAIKDKTVVIYLPHEQDY